MKSMTAVPRKDLIVFPADSMVHGKGRYLVVIKCLAGFPTTLFVDVDSPIDVFRRYKPKAIMNISKVNDKYNSTVFARVGKKVWIAEEMLVELTVGDINQELVNTGLYCQDQYRAVGAKSWACKAYVKNI